MVSVTDEQFQVLINESLEELPGEHVKNIKNVAILYEHEPTEEHIIENNLKPNETLLGLYQGVPLSERQGMQPTFPDRITLFIGPLCRHASSLAELKENIKHTLWHEIAHYYGLDHDDIAAKE
jgi:predicted Zn-dependent protease with MMP-like domain